MSDVAQAMAKPDKSGDERVPDRARPAATLGLISAPRISKSLCAVSLGLAAMGLLLLVLSREHNGVPVFEQWAEDLVVAVGFSTLGAVVAPRFPSRNLVGWLFCALGLVAAVLLFCGQYAAYALVARHGSLPGGEVAAWVVAWLWVVHSGLFAFLGLIFPDGRPPTRRWRRFAWLVAAVTILGAAAVALSPGPIDSLGSVRNPLGIEGMVNLSAFVEPLVFALTLGAAASLVARLRRAGGVERQQIKWFAYAAAVLAGGAMVSWVVSDALGVWWLRWEVGFVATMIGLAGLPAALGIAILRYRLHDIDLIINLTLVYGILTMVLAGVFEMTLVSLQHLVLVLSHEEDSQLAYFATALIMAALFEPLKRRIDAFVEHLFYRRDDRAAE